MNVESLRVKLGSLELDNPLVLASGVQGTQISSVLEALRRGAGAAITKSIGLEMREGYAEPTIVPCDSGYVNAVGLPNPGAESFSKELSALQGKSLPVLVSVFGSSAEEIGDVVRILDVNDFAGYELNLSCPHVKGVGTEVGHDPELVGEIVENVKSNTSKPVFVKLSPNTEKLLDVAASAVDAGADGLTAINTVRAIAIDVHTVRPSLQNVYGGLSGGAIRPIALRCVYDLAEHFEVPIMGCGGASSWEHAVQFMLAGASAVQVGSATLKGFGVFNDINIGILSYMQEKGYNRIRDMVGEAHTSGQRSKRFESEALT